MGVNFNRGRLLLVWIGLCWLVSLSGCATNPVTGKQELALISEAQELEIGRNQYLPSRQMQGGDYLADPGLQDYVRQVGERVAKQGDRKLPYEFRVVNDGSLNAWALPGGKIAINRGLLLELESEAELAAVLGHEVVHAAARHGAKGIERGMVLQGAVMVAAAAASESEYASLAVGAAGLGAQLINQSYSREAELEADHFGMNYMQQAGYDPAAAVKLQETFVRLSKGEQDGWLTGLFASHPPSPERVEKNRQHLKTLKGGGELGRARYQKAVAHLKRVAPAYQAYSEGQQALRKSQADQALRKATEAIRIEPREALFYGLKGDALQYKNAFGEALQAYDQAVALDGGFFRHFLQRGRLKSRLGDETGAKSDLQRSVSLLPTADAHYLLGELALNGGESDQALGHFREAAGADTESGRAAMFALVKLDLAEHPQRYLRVQLGMDREGYLQLRLENPSPVAVTSIHWQLDQRLVGGGFRTLGEARYPGRIAAGDSNTVRTDLQLTDRQHLKTLRARLLSAEIAN